jgi:hypothetical protein
MQLVYFKYFIQIEEDRYQNSIYPIMENFCQIKDPEFRKSFKTMDDENLFLFHVKGRIFLLVRTKRNELIQAISADTIAHEDIYQRLSQDEQLGFASYIYLHDEYYGIASTLSGPRNNYWVNFVAELLKRLSWNLNTAFFKSHAFEIELDREQALRMPFKSKAIIRINESSPWYQPFALQFGGGEFDAYSIELIFKPKKRKQMPGTYDALVRNVPEEGLEKFIVSAKEEMDGLLSDYFLIGAGHIHDLIRGTSEQEICKSIADLVNRNHRLMEAVNEYKQDQAYKHRSLPIILRYSDPDNWNNSILRNTPI